MEQKRMIEIKNFSKKYADNTVYENFDLSIEEGQVTCILGESGSGKTTLLNAVAGLTEYGGSITNLKCSYVFQTPRLVPNLTVFGNLKLVCDDDNKIYDMLEKVRLKDKANSYPIKLSGRQAQRVAIARAFLYDSEAILLDEPFASLDLKLKGEITAQFFEILRADNRTTLFVTHDVDEAAAIARRIIVIDKGRAVFDNVYGGGLPREYADAEKIRKELLSVLIA